MCCIQIRKHAWHAKGISLLMRSGSVVLALAFWTNCAFGRKLANSDADWRRDELELDCRFCREPWTRASWYCNDCTWHLADHAATPRVLAGNIGGRHFISCGFLPSAVTLRRPASSLLCCFHALWLVALVARRTR